MRVAYSVLRVIRNQDYQPIGSDYGLTQREFENFIFFLENQGLLERVLRLQDLVSLGPARLTEKGHAFLIENETLEVNYPSKREKLLEWVQVEKELYSNDS